ncbi:MAG: hypothetical protein BV459_01935 [Thermoplasmata archaeon M11B2D]|nr:MAG: hypothetical protein BV459_01935 [Thermoplasmata archaeon M11B2D]
MTRKVDMMVDLIDAILKGVDLISFFQSKYYGSIKFRPITMHEVNDVFLKSLVGHSIDAVKFATMFRFEKKEEVIETVEMLLEVNSIRHEMNKWIVYHSVKDFQPDYFNHVKNGIPLGIHAFNEEQCCLEIEEMAKEILDLSCAPRGDARAVLETASGDVIGTAIWKMDYQLVEKVEDLTDVQLYFIIETYNKYTGETEKEKGDLKRFMEKMNFKPVVTEMTNEQRDIIKRLNVIKNEQKSK